MTAALRNALRLALNRERRAELGLHGKPFRRSDIPEKEQLPASDWLDRAELVSEVPLEDLLAEPWDPDGELRLLFPLSRQYRW